MLATQSIKTITPPVLRQEAGANAASGPETEEFDFMDYLLGLQETKGTSAQSGDAAALINQLSNSSVTTSEAKVEPEKGESDLASLFPGISLPGMNLLHPEPAVATQSEALPEPKINLGEGNLPNLIRSSAVKSEAQKPTDDAAADIDIANLETAANPTQDLPDTSFAAGLRAFQAQLGNSPVEGKRPGESRLEMSTDGGEVILPPQIASISNQEIVSSKAEEKRAETAAMDVKELFSRVDSLARQGGGTMKVTLNPPELGAIEVQVSTHGRHVQVEMKSELGTTKSILESGLGDLKHSIQSQDLIVSKFEVNVSKDIGRDLGNTWTPNGQNAFSQFSGAQSGESRSQSGFSRGNRSGDRREEVSSLGRLATVSHSSRINNGRLDVRI